MVYGGWGLIGKFYPLVYLDIWLFCAIASVMAMSPISGVRNAVRIN